MSYLDNSTDNPLKIVWPIVLAGGAIGLILSWLVLSGDQQGRVNLFYLLLVYLFIPVLSVIASVISLFFGKGVNLARLIASLPLLSFHTKTLIRKTHQLSLDKYWFLMQSQAAAIAFSVASLVTFFTLLLATDLNFVWRSTILEPRDIFPLLESIAAPWTFWQAAQPTMQLLEMTQDFRMTSRSGALGDYGAWWKFILATQLCYSLLLRIALITGTRWWLKRSFKMDIEQTFAKPVKEESSFDEPTCDLSSVVSSFDKSLAINNWDGIPLEILALIPSLDLSSDNMLINGWQGTDEQQKAVNEWQGEQIVIVKAWEGPLGELEDFLKLSKGYLLPLDWNDSGLVTPKVHHFQEWQRFINTLADWQLYVPKELTPNE